MYVLFCEDLGDKAPDICYLRLIDTTTNRIARRGRHTWFSLLGASKFDLLTDNLCRAMNCAYVWEPLESPKKESIREMDMKLIAELVDKQIIQYCEKCDRYYDARSGCPADIKSEECAVGPHHNLPD